MRKYVSRKCVQKVGGIMCAACVHCTMMQRAKRAPGGFRVSGFRF